MPRTRKTSMLVKKHAAAVAAAANTKTNKERGSSSSRSSDSSASSASSASLEKKKTPTTRRRGRSPASSTSFKGKKPQSSSQATQKKNSKDTSKATAPAAASTTTTSATITSQTSSSPQASAQASPRASARASAQASPQASAQAQQLQEVPPLVVAEKNTNNTNTKTSKNSNQDALSILASQLSSEMGLMSNLNALKSLAAAKKSKLAASNQVSSRRQTTNPQESTPFEKKGKEEEDEEDDDEEYGTSNDSDGDEDDDGSDDGSDESILSGDDGIGGVEQEYKNIVFDPSSSQVLLPVRNTADWTPFFADSLCRFLRPIFDHVNAQQQALLFSDAPPTAIQSVTKTMVNLEKLARVVNLFNSINLSLKKEERLIGNGENSDAAVVYRQASGLVDELSRTCRHPKHFYGMYSLALSASDTQLENTQKNSIILRNHLIAFLAGLEQVSKSTSLKLMDRFAKIDSAWMTNDNFLVGDQDLDDKTEATSVTNK